MGCALVTFKEARFRDLILQTIQDENTTDTSNNIKIDKNGIKSVLFFIGDVQVSAKPRQEKDTKLDVPNDIFVGWGRKAEL